MATKFHRIPHYFVRFVRQNFRQVLQKPASRQRLLNFQYLRPYIRSRLFPSTDDQKPWLNYELCQWINDLPRGLVIEFGAGRSTVWLARLGFHVLSIEHQEDWARKVRESLQAEKLNELVDLRLINAREEDKNSCQAYLSPLLSEADSSPPMMILVDGIFRNECLAASAEKYGSRTSIVLHDSDWPIYQDGVATLKKKFRLPSKGIFGPGYGTPDFTSAIIFEKSDLFNAF